MANCIDIIVKLFREISPEIATNERAKEFEKSYLAARSKAEQRGHNMDTLIPIDPDKPNGPKTSYNKIWAIDAYSRIIEDIHAQEYIKQLDNLAVENRLDDIRINMQWLEKYYPGEKNRGKRALKAFNSLIFRTNETYGHGTLEGNVDTDTKALFGRMLVKLQEYLPDEKDIVGLFQDTNRTKSFFDEFYHIINQRDWETAKNSQPLTGDKTAFAMAKAFIETNLFGPYYDLNALGKKVDLYDARPKVAFKLYKMKKSAMLKKYDEAQATADKNDFIEFLAERLHDRHGSFEAKKDLATTIFSRYVDNELHDWRIADEIVRETKEFRISEKRDLSQGKITKDQIDEIPGVLEYKDGKSFMEVNEKFGSDLSLGEILHRTVNENGRKLGLVKTFGPNYRENFDKIASYIKSGKLKGESIRSKEEFFTDGFRASGFWDRKIGEGATDYADHMMNPYKAEAGHSSFMGTFFGATRNLEIVKLGTAPITQLGDFASFLAVGWNRLGTNLNTMVDGLFQYNFKGNKNERDAYNALVLDFAEVMHGSMQDRFRMMDHSGVYGNTRMGDGAIKGTAGLAHFVMRFTGFNWINRSLASGAAGTAYREIGNMIKSAKLWDDLKPEQRFLFEKYGIRKEDYDIMLNSGEKILDGNGRLNLYRFSDDTDPNFNVYQSRNIQNKLMSLINEITESMVIKPSALDRTIVGFFATPGSTSEQFFKAVMQFKSFMISFSRKILMADIHRGVHGSSAERIQMVKNISLLYALMLPIAYTITQAKQVVAGQKMYEPAEGVQKAFQYTNFLPFIGDLYWETGGESLYDALFGDGQTRPPTGSEFISRLAGPVINDFVSLANGTYDITVEGIRSARDLPNAEERFDRAVSRVSKVARGLDPFANMWQTKAISRHVLWDAWLEWVDPKGYRRLQRRIEKRARDERGGELYNVYGKFLRGE